MNPEWSMRSAQGSLPLEWHGETAFYQIREGLLADSSQYTLEEPSGKELLRGARSLRLGFLQGFSLVTTVPPLLLERHLLPKGGRDGYGAAAVGPVLLLRSDISFSGDSFHRLHSSLLKTVRDDFRKQLVNLHFRMLNLLLQAIHGRLNSYLRCAQNLLNVVNIGFRMTFLASLLQLPLVLFSSPVQVHGVVSRTFPVTVFGLVFFCFLRSLVWLLRIRMKFLIREWSGVLTK